jgi:hypothetical protein
LKILPSSAFLEFLCFLLLVPFSLPLSMFYSSKPSCSPVALLKLLLLSSSVHLISYNKVITCDYKL